MRTIQVKAKIVIPEVPDIFRCEDGVTLPVDAIGQEGLKAIGKEWTKALLEKAGRKPGRPRNTKKAEVPESKDTPQATENNAPQAAGGEDKPKAEQTTAEKPLFRCVKGHEFVEPRQVEGGKAMCPKCFTLNFKSIEAAAEKL